MLMQPKTQCASTDSSKLNKSTDVLTRSWEGIEPWVIEKYNTHVKTFQQTDVTNTRWMLWKFFRLKEDISGMELESIFLCVPACGPGRRWREWTSGWRIARRSVESRIFCCCFHRPLAAAEDADSPDGQKNKSLIPTLPSYHTISQTTDPPKGIVLEAFSDTRTGH